MQFQHEADPESNYLPFTTPDALRREALRRDRRHQFAETLRCPGTIRLTPLVALDNIVERLSEPR